MAVYYFDSSGLVKRYRSEIGSAWVMGLTAPASQHAIYVARITGVEVVSAITRAVKRSHCWGIFAMTWRINIRSLKSRWCSLSERGGAGAIA